MKEKFEQIKFRSHNFLKLHWKVILIVFSALLALIVLFQVFYPSNRMALFANVDNFNYGGWSKDDVVKDLNSKYKNHKFSIYFGQSKKLTKTLLPSDIGITNNNASRINKMSYPWYLRIVPSSIFWSHSLTDNVNKVQYDRNETTLDSYINKQFGESCSVSPINAGLKVNGAKFVVIKSENGGDCDMATVREKLQTASPTIVNDYKINIPIKEILPTIDDNKAKKFGQDLNAKIKDGTNINVNNVPQLIPFDDLISWIDFSTDNNILSYSFNPDRAAVFLNKQIAPKVSFAAGTSYVSTYNFIETARVNGASGVSLNISNTLKNLKSFIDGDSSSASVATITLAPKVVYSRSYSPNDTGLSALIQQYAEDHSGVFGVSMIELSGANRRASYNDTKRFTSASTYKLFVAYSVLKRIEDGSWSWSDANIYAGRNLSTCFDDMIARSDNGCAEALAEKIKYSVVTSEAHAIGCASTSFGDSKGMNTTAADLALFLAQLRSGQILSQQSSRDILMNAMSRNIFRNGIPAGLSGIPVANKVGFIDGFLHDASIVYSPSGNYILVIMTDGSSWSMIADLAAKIEALRAQ